MITKDMPGEAAVSHLAGWLTYLEGAWIPEEVRNLALSLVQEGSF